MRSALLGDRSYVAAILATGPAFYVPMQGSQVIEIIRGNPATVSATAPLIALGPFAGANAYRFSASTADNDSFAIPTHTSYHPGTTSFSIGGWFNRAGAGAAFPSMLGLSNNDIGMGFGNTDDKPALGKVNVGDIWKATNSITRGLWYHFVVTKIGGSTAIGYLNGEAVAGTYTAQTISTTAGNPTFGVNSGGSTNDFDGSLAHWAIWRRVLSPADVRYLYIAGITGPAGA